MKAPLFGQGATTAESSAANVAPPEKLSFFKTIRLIQQHLSHEKNRAAFKGLALQYGPELVLPALFTVPVIGWGAGLIGMPFAWWLNKKGEKIVETEKEKLKGTKDNPIFHALEIRDIWNGKYTKDMTHKLADHFNELIRTIFPGDCQDAKTLRHTLKFTTGARESKSFAYLNRLVNARQAFEETWYLSWPLKPLSFLYEKIPVLPRAFKMVFLIPKFFLIGLFYLLKQAPKHV